MELEQFQLVLLYRPPDAPDYNEATLTALQRDHIEFYRGLREAGHVVTNGPVLDPPDPKLRGLAFFTVESLGRALDLAGNDPLIKAGRIELRAMEWCCPPGTMVAPGTTVTT